MLCKFHAKIKIKTIKKQELSYNCSKYFLSYCISDSLSTTNDVIDDTCKSSIISEFLNDNNTKYTITTTCPDTHVHFIAEYYFYDLPDYQWISRGEPFWGKGNKNLIKTETDKTLEGVL
jgi:hypothetical protein